ncbi:MAG: hypothetical protein IPL53_01290 [Ignavibacteria bacterium]|nr:hypothetical protein [Ignavibacteria bacterium]
MNFTLIDTTDTWLIVSIQFAVMLIFIFLGSRFAKIKRFSKSEFDSNSSIITAIYSLVALLLAFTFSMAGSRFDSRKLVIVEEANCIGTAVLRADMYADSVRVLFREDFKNYLEARIAYYEAHSNIQKVRESLQSSVLYSDKLWERATKLSMDKDNFVASNQMIPALNSMFDIANTRLHGELYKIPDAIILLLLGLLLIASFIFGFMAESKGIVNWYIAFCFCLVTAMTMYFLIDLDRPRRGLINLDDSNIAIIELRKMF